MKIPNAIQNLVLGKADCEEGDVATVKSQRYRWLIYPILLCGVVHAQANVYSEAWLDTFYEGFTCGQKQTLSEANVTSACFVSFWVSPNGNDGAAGTQNAPFLTLERARDAVRALPPSAFDYSDVFVYIEDGTYRLSETFSLNVIDSGRNGHDVVYTAAPNAHPVICGSIPVTGWAHYNSHLGIYVASVPPVTSRQLYVNGQRAIRARTTDNPFGFKPAWPLGIEYIPTSNNDPSWFDPLTWTNQSSIEAVITTQWKMMRVPVGIVLPYTTPLPGLILMQDPAWTNANVYFDINTNLPGEWSFFEVTWFENALAFLTDPGEWYLDTTNHLLYYKPLPNENILTATVELPILETLIEGSGSLGQPIHNIRFEGLTFSYATWMDPSGTNGYVSDQSGQLLIGFGHDPNYIGHDQHVVPTPGNLLFSFAQNISFYGNIFEHLGAAGLQFISGSSNNSIDSNLFTDISSAAITLGGATSQDSHPTDPGYILANNVITNNLIRDVAVEYLDAAGIFVGFTSQTTIANNTIDTVPWSGIAMGWGWGLLDVGSFPGLLHAVSGDWGVITTPTPNNNSKILRNQISHFLGTLWDGGAIYTTGQQGPSLDQGLLIEGNVAFGKRPDGGGNTFYTDGGSRYIQLQSNASYDNPIGITYYGPLPNAKDPFYPFFPPPYYLQNNQPYGSDSGGCVTYGDIQYVDNYWLEAPIPANEANYNLSYYALISYYPYRDFGFFNICPYLSNGVSYPVNLSYFQNTEISSSADIPSSILNQAGVQSRPPTIPADQWVIP